MFKAFCVAAVVGLGAGSASAAVMQAVITGTVVSGTDPTGIFVDPGAALDGYDFEATYIYDTALGIRERDLGDLPPYDYVYGGSSNSLDTPVTSASVKINGRSQSFSAEYSGFAGDSGGFLTYNAGIDDGYDSASLFFSWEHSAAEDLPVDLETPFTLMLDPNESVSMKLYMQSASPAGLLLRMSVSLAPREITVSVVGGPPPPPVPLPAAFPLLMAALGALAFLRRRTI